MGKESTSPVRLAALALFIGGMVTAALSQIRIVDIWVSMALFVGSAMLLIAGGGPKSTGTGDDGA